MAGRMQQAAGSLGAGRGEHGAPLIVAHRGAWDSARQNSIEAVDRAIALGCDGIEIDVRRTADGRLVLVHDARIRGRTVRRLEHQEVQARMKAGQAPLLDDVLRRAAGRIVVDVELKEDGYVEEAVAAVTSRLSPEQFVVTSFRPRVLAQVRRLAPEARTGLLVWPRRLRELERLRRLAQPTFLAPHVALARTTNTFAWAAEHGLPLWVWTVNDPRALRALHADPRVSAVITDQPGRAMQLYAAA
jgi:glycerophosphoryl diester phosphodiesterase